MRILNEALRQRGRPLNVALVGCGWWGSGVAQYLVRREFLHPRVLVDKDIDKCLRALRDAGVGDDDIARLDSPNDLATARQARYIVMRDLALFDTLLPELGVDVIHEAIGEVLPGVETALSAIRHRIPFTTVNSEMDATVGLVLCRRAEAAGIVYSNSDGDQPGCLARMLDDITAWGFEPRIIGNNKLFLDYYQTPEGVMPWVPEGGNPYVMASAADGSKLALELSVVANAYNFPPLQRGMFGPETSKADLIRSFDELVSLDSLTGGHIDYTLGSTEPDMGGPVFVVAYSDDPRLRAEMQHYKKGPGPHYLFFRDHHIGSIEAPATIVEAAVFGSAALKPTVWCSDVVAVAKRDLEPGEPLGLMGGYTYYGLAERADVALQDAMLPIGLAEFATMTRGARKDDILTYDMVDLEDNVAVRLRREQDAMIRPAAG